MFHLNDKIVVESISTYNKFEENEKYCNAYYNISIFQPYYKIVWAPRRQPRLVAPLIYLIWCYEKQCGWNFAKTEIKKKKELSQD